MSTRLSRQALFPKSTDYSFNVLKSSWRSELEKDRNDFRTVLLGLVQSFSPAFIIKEERVNAHGWHT